MKRFAFLCLGLLVASTSIGCCCFPGWGACGGGGYYGAPAACPGGNCGTGFYPPTGASYQTYTSAPVAVAPAPAYYSPYPTTALNYLPTY